MRDENVRTREKFELSLDGRQIASIVVGALVILAVVFVLGLNVGRQISVRQAEVARAGDLDALDRPTAAAPAVDGASLTFHDRLTNGRPPPNPKIVPTTAPAVATAAATPTATLASTTASAASTATPSSTSTAAPIPAPAPTAKPTSAASSPSDAKASAADSVRAGAYTIQVGAAQGRPEAERLAARFRTWKPRVEPADVDGKGRWYRVRVGSFASRDEAERARKDVARATGVSGFVTASR